MKETRLCDTRLHLHSILKFSWNFLVFFYLNSLVIQQLVMYPVHSVSDNNLALFHLWWRDITLKSKKVSRYFVTVVWKISSCFFFFKRMRENSKNVLVLEKNIKSFNRYITLAIWLPFSAYLKSATEQFFENVKCSYLSHLNCSKYKL